jgi:CRISPR-associated protein Cas1
MEAYRPYVDLIVCNIMETTGSYETTDCRYKKQLLSIVTNIDIYRRKNSPLMVAMSRTTNSLQQCFEGTVRKIYIRYMYDEHYTCLNNTEVVDLSIF